MNKETKKRILTTAENGTFEVFLKIKGRQSDFIGTILHVGDKLFEFKNRNSEEVKLFRIGNITQIEKLTLERTVRIERKVAKTPEKNAKRFWGVLDTIYFIHEQEKQQPVIKYYRKIKTI